MDGGDQMTITAFAALIFSWITFQKTSMGSMRESNHTA